MDRRTLHDGRADGLQPLESLSTKKVDSFASLLRAMSKTAFSGRQLGEAFDVLLEMSRSEKCHTVMTLTGELPQEAIDADLVVQSDRIADLKLNYSAANPRTKKSRKTIVERVLIFLWPF